MGITRPIYLFSKTPYEGVFHIPLLEIEFLHVTLDLNDFDLIVMTSKQALMALEYIVPEWKKLPVIAVSEPTAELVRNYGGTCVAQGNGYGESLYDLILNAFPDKRLLYPSAEVLASDFAQRLQNANVAITRKVIYRTRCNTQVIPEELEANAVLIFTAPSAVSCYLQCHELLPTQQVIAIGSTTAAALPENVSVLIPKMPSVAEAVALAQGLD